MGFIWTIRTAERPGAAEAAEGCYATQAQDAPMRSGQYYGSAPSDPVLDPNGTCRTDGGDHQPILRQGADGAPGVASGSAPAPTTANVAATTAVADHAGNRHRIAHAGQPSSMLSVRSPGWAPVPDDAHVRPWTGSVARRLPGVTSKPLAAGDISGAGFIADLISSAAFDKRGFLNPGAVPFTGTQSLWIQPRRYAPTPMGRRRGRRRHRPTRCRSTLRWKSSAPRPGIRPVQVKIRQGWGGWCYLPTRSGHAARRSISGGPGIARHCLVRRAIDTAMARRARRSTPAAPSRTRSILGHLRCHDLRQRPSRRRNCDYGGCWRCSACRLPAPTIQGRGLLPPPHDGDRCPPARHPGGLTMNSATDQRATP